MSEGYTVYPGHPEPQPTPQPGRWQVLVEYANQGNAKPPTLLHVFPVEFETRAEALAEAERQAHKFDPPDPAMPQGRQVYADGEGFLSVVQGAMSVFHFSTRVVRPLGPQHVGTEPADQAFLDRAAHDGAVI